MLTLIGAHGSKWKINFSKVASAIANEQSPDSLTGLAKSLGLKETLHALEG